MSAGELEPLLEVKMRSDICGINPTNFNADQFERDGQIVKQLLDRLTEKERNRVYACI